MRSVIITLLLSVVSLTGCQSRQMTENVAVSTVKVATFNVSMDVTNYIDRGQSITSEQASTLLKTRLKDGTNVQIRHIAEIIQRVRPDILLLNEFDYIDDPTQGVEAFIKNYLNQSQNGAEAIDYPYYYYAPTNTGVPTEFDLNNDGKFERYRSDALGFGYFPGHFAMVLLSKYPIDQDRIRTFRNFRWADMPGALKPFYPDSGESWYSEEEWAQMRLSSKSHWDVPINIGGKTIHFLASHPTPPVFDGPEDSYGKRNHDEIRFWTDYIGKDKGRYIYDDNGQFGTLGADASFIVIGDLNAALHNSDARVDGIASLLNLPRVNDSFVPQSEGGAQNRPDPHANIHTAAWGARADYVLPSTDLKVLEGEVFWPTKNSPYYYLVADRKTSTDHRMVWLKIKLD